MKISQKLIEMRIMRDNLSENNEKKFNKGVIENL